MDQRRLLLAIQLGVLTVILSLTCWFLLPDWTALVVVLLAAAGLGWGWVLVARNARSYGYAERAEDLYLKHGVLVRRLVVVPYGRMQYVDVHAGPLDQLFKIANVHLHTASPGTSAVIPGLPADEAARLRDRLTALGESQAAGL